MHLISYDIQNDSLRVKLSKALIRYGLHRVQYSVFMGDLRDSALHKIKTVLNQLSKDKSWSVDDSVMILPLHQYSEDHISFVGKPPSRWDEISGEIHTLIL